MLQKLDGHLERKNPGKINPEIFEIKPLEKWSVGKNVWIQQQTCNTRTQFLVKKVFIVNIWNKKKCILFCCYFLLPFLCVENETFFCQILQNKKTEKKNKNMTLPPSTTLYYYSTYSLVVLNKSRKFSNILYPCIN